ncbi:MAG: hypothetical protein ACREBU_21545, partial [Nitrososphaera sp.]
FYLDYVARTSEFRVTIYDGSSHRVVGPEEIVGTFDRLFSNSPLMLPFWNAHSLLLMTYYISSSKLRSRGLRFEAIADDSIGGLLTGHLFNTMGLRWRRLSFSSPMQRLEDIKTLLIDRPNIVIAADSHGPYRSVSAGMARLGRSYNGFIRPLSLWCDRSFRVFRRIDMVVPIPYSRIVFAIGPEIIARPYSHVKDLQHQLQTALVNLEAETRPLVTPRVIGS